MRFLHQSRNDPRTPDEWISEDHHAGTQAAPDVLLRRLVDLLPAPQRKLVSEIYFGGAPLITVANELGLTRSQAETMLGRAYKQLALWIADPPEGETLLEVDQPKPEPDQCSAETEWGTCVQPAREAGLCAAHLEWINRGITPDPDYERSVVLGLREPIQARLSDVEMDTLVNGRYRGDGRRLDQYTCPDPLGYEP